MNYSWSVMKLLVTAMNNENYYMKLAYYSMVIENTFSFRYIYFNLTFSQSITFKVTQHAVRQDFCFDCDITFSYGQFGAHYKKNSECEKYIR